MGAEVIIFGQSLNSQFLKGLTHSAVVNIVFVIQHTKGTISFLDAIVTPVSQSVSQSVSQ